MHRRLKLLLLTITVAVISSAAGAKEKQKSPMPFTVLEARTVTVVIDPDAGAAVTDPLANHRAQKDVEAAIEKWGRFKTVLSQQSADLIIVLRKGNGRAVQPTIRDPQSNSRAGSVTTTDDSISIGAQHGSQPGLSGKPQTSTQERSPMQVEAGETEDMFLVYPGHVDQPLDSPAIWRYRAKDGLKPPAVPAVDAFRKALAETEKAAAAAQKP